MRPGVSPLHTVWDRSVIEALGKKVDLRLSHALGIEIGDVTLQALTLDVIVTDRAPHQLAASIQIGVSAAPDEVTVRTVLDAAYPP